MTAAWVKLAFSLLLFVLRSCIFVDTMGLIFAEEMFRVDDYWPHSPPEEAGLNLNEPRNR